MIPRYLFMFFVLASVFCPRFGYALPSTQEHIVQGTKLQKEQHAITLPSDNICLKVYSSVMVVAGMFLTGSVLVGLVFLTFLTVIGIPIGLAVLYLYVLLLKRVLKGRFKKIDRRWDRDK